MNEHEIKERVISILSRIVPEAELKAMDPDISFRDQFDIEADDYLQFVVELDDYFQVEIPETDFSKFSTLNNCIDILMKNSEVMG